MIALKLSGSSEGGSLSSDTTARQRWRSSAVTLPSAQHLVVHRADVSDEHVLDVGDGEQGLPVDRLQLVAFSGFDLAVRHDPLDEGRQLVFRLRARVAHDAPFRLSGPRT